MVKKFLIVLAVLAFASAASAAVPSMMNGDFESGIGGWYIGGEVVVDSVSGSNVLEIDGAVSASEVSQNAWYTGIEPGDEVLLSFDFRQVSGDPIWADSQVFIRFFDEGPTNLLQQDLVWHSGAATTEWNRFDGTVAVAPAGAAVMDVLVYGNMSLQETPLAYHFDNFTMVPEPATMMILGLGGVLLRRKRA